MDNKKNVTALSVENIFATACKLPYCKEEIRQFVEMCFDPKSSINPRLKEMLVRMLTERQDP